MDRATLIHKRKGKLLAQLLSSFEQQIEPRIPGNVAQRFKAEVRGKLQALATDSVEIMELDEGAELNGHAQAVRDTLDANAGVGGNTR